jgi:hypothetical protein
MSIREEHQGSLEPVLRAAAAPAHPAELAGEQEAVAAFLAAAPAPRRRSFLARVLTVKAMVIAGVATSTTVVLAAVSGVLPAPWPQQPSVPPADNPPAIITTTSQPAMTPPAGHPPVESEQADEDQVQPDAPATGQPQQDSRPCDHCDGDRRDRSPDESDGDKSPKGGKQDKSPTSPPSAVPPSGTRSPDSSASGAETAVPPSGAKPPTKGG